MKNIYSHLLQYNKGSMLATTVQSTMDFFFFFASDKTKLVTKQSQWCLLHIRHGT